MTHHRPVRVVSASGAIALLALLSLGCEPPTTTGTSVFGGAAISPPEPATTWSSGLSSDSYVVVRAADVFSCAADSRGVTRCWGDYYSVDSDWPVDLDWIDLDAAGAGEICAALAAGGVRCWGEAADNDLSVFEGTAVIDLDVGHGHQVCGVTAEGELLCAPHHYLGRDFGLADAPSGDVWDRVSGGEFHTCALTVKGSISCWGRDDSPTYAAQLQAPAGQQFVHVDAGTYHTCAVTAAGRAVCWGAGVEVRDPEPTTMLSHVGQAAPPTEEVFVEVAAGGFHTCGLTRDGTAVCWGDDSRGQLAAPPRDDLVQLSAGWDHTCAVTASGPVVCWGDGAYAY